MTDERRQQVLRTIDKAGRIGISGVIELLQKPAAEFGAGLNKFQALLIGSFLETKGADNKATLQNMRDWFDRAPQAVRRMELAVILEDTPNDQGGTALDTLISMRHTDDQTWADGKRPANIAWALDDIAEEISRTVVK